MKRNIVESQINICQSDADKQLNETREPEKKRKTASAILTLRHAYIHDIGRRTNRAPLYNYTGLASKIGNSSQPGAPTDAYRPLRSAEASQSAKRTRK